MNIGQRATMAAEQRPKLSPFEEYMFRDDTVRYPMSLFLRLHLTGEFDSTSFEQACVKVAAQHWRLNSVVKAVNGTLRWIAASAEDAESIVVDSTAFNSADSATDFAACGHIDLTRRPGLQIRIAASSSEPENAATAETRVIFQFHHACCDGVGAVGYIRDVLESYHSSKSVDRTNSATHPVQLSLAKKVVRGLYVRLPNLFFGALRLKDFLRRRPRVLARQSEPESSGTTVITRSLNKQDSAECIDRAKREGVTVNDLLIHHLMLTLREQFQIEERENIRLLTPINLRESVDSGEVRNHVGMIFVDRNLNQLESPQLLSKISREMRRVKRWRLGQTSLRTLRAVRLMPGGMQGFLKSRDCWATAVLSNLGHALDNANLPRGSDGKLQFDRLQLERLDFVPPIRDQTNVAFGIATYGGQIHLSMRYDSGCLTHEQARALLEAFAARAYDTEGILPAPQPSGLSSLC